MTVIRAMLIHGFNKHSNDMKPLQHHLEELGYTCLLPELPLTFQDVEDATALLEDIMSKLDNSEGQKVHLIGHSTGGLVIRKLITNRNYTDKIGRCVLIATPNNGNKLAMLASKVKLYTKIFKTIKSLTKEKIDSYQFSYDHKIEIAAIAGNKNQLWLGRLLDKANDGRVEVDSVYFPELTDFTTLPYGHKEIHHQKETAEMVDRFLRGGRLLPR
ncbi:alpha/beta fold hydrolase [Halalkalibacter sp. APA_J-10(15)]|uniref:alpha/beta fold hydrolase n=1 Tax=unclassified Halalkalibacter TaxID=2893063 RepID=UPI001FF28D5A|nr:alpha/beta fold hydrolase [Halalkalibacter sp. APA_J-10(15)]MCK0470195.1 alpha/beta hydrolase [Halalkalibacter sp. APA_J-10(15)]